MYFKKIFSLLESLRSLLYINYLNAIQNKRILSVFLITEITSLFAVQSHTHSIQTTSMSHVCYKKGELITK